MTNQSLTLASIGMRPTMRQLEYLVALDAHGHVGRAAAACFVTQPTLSAQIRELEKHVGVAVTERVGRGIAVTAAGRELAARARVILQAAASSWLKAKFQFSPRSNQHCAASDFVETLRDQGPRSKL